MKSCLSGSSGSGPRWRAWPGLASGLTLSDGLAAAQALYGPVFPVRECLKALVVFADGDLAALGDSERRRLEQAVLAVDGIPSLKRISRELGPSQP